MEWTEIERGKLYLNEGQIPGVESNPRRANSAGLKGLRESLMEYPELFEYRGLIVYPFGDGYVVLCGNHRLKSTDGERDKYPCVVVDAGCSVEDIRAFIYKDNVNYGHWIDSELKRGWSIGELAGANLKFKAAETDLPTVAKKALAVKLPPDEYYFAAGVLRDAGAGEIEKGLLKLLGL